MLAVVGSCLPIPAAAQSFSLQDFPSDRTEVRLRALRPMLAGGHALRGASGSYDLYGSRPLRASVSFFGTLAFNVADGPFPPAFAPGRQDIDHLSGSGGTEFDADARGTEAKLSSLGFGLQAREGRSAQACVTIALYVPLATLEDERSVRVGRWGDPYAPRRSLPEVLVTYLNMAHRVTSPQGVFVGIEVGAEVGIGTGRTGGGTGWLHAGASAGMQTGPVTVLAEYVALLWPGNAFEARSQLLAFGAEWSRSAVRPGLFWQMPLDPYLERVLDGVLGFQLEFQPGGAGGGDEEARNVELRE
jgi:hypothetical protein